MTNKRRLRFHRETLAQLTSTNLSRVAGGPGHGQTNRCATNQFGWCTQCYDTGAVTLCVTNCADCNQTLPEGSQHYWCETYETCGYQCAESCMDEAGASCAYGC